MAWRFWLTHPVKAWHRLRFWLWERRHPDLPWLCPGTIRFLEAHLTMSMIVLEFGSGRSTRWFAQRVGKITSLEYDAAWFDVVQKQLAESNLTNVDLQHVPLSHPREEGEQSVYDPMPEYVAFADHFADGSLHCVVVDGHYRTHCVRRSVPKVAPGGYLLLDDVNMWPSLAALPIPSTWRIADDSTNGLKRCVIWQAA